MSSFLFELDPLIRVGLARARIEPDRVRLESGPNSGLRVGLSCLLDIYSRERSDGTTEVQRQTHPNI